MPAPEGFRLPTAGESAPGGVLKAVTGSHGTQAFKVSTHKMFNAKKSDEAGLEVEDAITIVTFRNDPYTEAVIREADLSPEQQVQTAEARDRFYTSKDSTDTMIAEWQAIHDSEKMKLALIGVVTVEQLAAWPEFQMFKLGGGAKDLVAKARRHVDTKIGNRAGEANADHLAVLAELKRLREAEAEKDARYFEMQARLAELEAGQKGGKKKTALPEAVQTA